MGVGAGPGTRALTGRACRRVAHRPGARGGSMRSGHALGLMHSQHVGALCTSTPRCAGWKALSQTSQGASPALR